VKKIDNNLELICELNQILDNNRDKRVVVVGTTCAGKSTLLKNIENAYDMDDLIFPQLTKEEHGHVCHYDVWTPEIGKTMIGLVKDKIKIEPGKPVFGTVVLDSDLIVYLCISDDLLEKRTKMRNAKFENAKNMQNLIEDEIKKSIVPVIEFLIS